ncbi:MAG: hypothetical protein ACHQAY_16980 [Hyphomicrobiales bacterium]
MLAVYGLVLQALLSGAAASASIVSGASGAGIICRGDARHADPESDAAQRAHGRNCACQALCPQHLGAGIDPAGATVRLVPRHPASRLAELPANHVPGPSEARPASFARAPPRPG